MPFERLLFTSCLLPGLTRFKESKIGVSIQAQQDESILFFCIDSNSTGHTNCGNCGLRNDFWGNQQGQRICDLVVFYAKEERRVLCFVELKDNKSELNDAVEQVINTYRAFKPHLKLSSHYTIQAFLIGHHGAAPQRHTQAQNALTREFEEGNFIYNARDIDFANFLRGATGSSQNSAKNKRKNRRQK
ncbi:MAG: hypothetical protein JXI43_05480 [Tissierellales bacterium]|nr:hypothetical protein [Tissierellales bacterium]